MGLIYKRTSPNEKYYIGQTTQPEIVRWNSHVNEALNSQDDNCHLLNAAIRKYGKDNFQVEILEDNIPNEQLNEKEQYYIELYHSYFLDPPYIGYNMTRGGDGVLKYSDEDILKGWNQGLGISEIAEQVGCTRPIIRYRLNNLGINLQQRLERTSLRSSEKQTEFELYKEEVLLLYQEGKSMREIGQLLSRSPTTIKKYLLKLGITDMVEQALKKKYKSIYQMDLNNNIINEFKSVTEAARVIKPDNPVSAKGFISAVARGNTPAKSAYGYKWKYKGE